MSCLHGSPTKNFIEKANTTLLQCQVKNASDPVRVYPDPMLVGSSENNLPIISLILQFGVERDNGQRVTVETMDKGIDAPYTGTRSSSRTRASPADLNRRHYIITIYGCTSKSFSCIPEESRVYSHLLKAPNRLSHFPRADLSENASAVRSMKRAMYIEDKTQWR